MCLIISSVGYGGNGVLRLSCASLNALNKPFHSGALALINMFVLLVPLSFGLSKAFGITGVFYAMPVSSLIAGALSLFTLKRIIREI